MTKVSPTTLILEVSVRAPFLFPGSTAGRFGLDAVALRNQSGELLIPQDQVRGVFKDMATLLGFNKLIQLFGAGSDDALTQNSTRFDDTGRTRLFFTDLVGAPRVKRKDDLLAVPYPRVEIDEDIGAAKSGHLAMIEQAALPGDIVDFKGTITFFDTDVEERREEIQTTLSSLRQIGKLKSIGFGEIVNAEVGPSIEETAKVLKPATRPKRFLWRFSIDRPFLVNADRVSGNVFKGRAEVPGSALKGCIINNLKLRGATLNADELSKIQISFARPADAIGVLPLSIGVSKGPEMRGKLVDVFTNAGGEENSAPYWSGVKAQNSFKPEDWLAVEELFGKNTTLYEERTHTAIDPGTGAAKDNKLFSYVAVVPDREGYEATIDLSDVDQNTSGQIFDLLDAQIFGLGKTGATLDTVQIRPSSRPAISSAGNDLVSILIMTPTLIIDPRVGVELSELYKEAWLKLLPGSELLDFATKQSPAGGYIGRRFGSAQTYQPFWLTSPGSVFLLRVGENDVERLQEHCAFGIIASSTGGAPPTWQNCPFLPENGFGEISVNENRLKARS